MSLVDILYVGLAIVASLGGGSLLVLALSSWLGKVWAQRLMERDRATHQRDLEQLRADLTKRNEEEVSRLKAGLDIFKEKHLRGHADKLATYRTVIDLTADLLSDIDNAIATGILTNDPRARIHQFNRDRLKAYGYLAMLAPQSVMDANDSMVGYLFEVLEGSTPYEWPQVRTRALRLVNEIRKDIGVDASEIEYRGNR